MFRVAGSGWVAAALLLLALAFLVPYSAEADGPPATQSMRDWLFEVQIVRVVNAEATMAEKVPAWTRDGGDARIALTWPRILELLKERGETTILLDGDTTTTEDMQTEIVHSRARSHTMFERKDENNTYWKSVPLKEGVQVKLYPRAKSLEYEVEVTDTLPRQAAVDADAAATPLQGLWRVKGTLVGGTGGRTFVLSRREQLLEQGQPAVTVEHYAFLTQRPLGSSR